MRERVVRIEKLKERFLEGIDLVILDWSGVVSDDRKPVYEADMRCLAPDGRHPYTFEEWLVLTERFSTVGALLRAHGFEGDDETLFGIFKQHYSEVVASGIKPEMYPEVSEVLCQLKFLGKPLLVLSSHPVGNLAQEAKDYGIAEFFDYLFGGIQNKTEALRNICQKMGINSQAVLYIGDTLFDIRAAKEAGLKSAGISTGYHRAESLAKEQPDILLKSLSEILIK